MVDLHLDTTTTHPWMSSEILSSRQFPVKASLTRSSAETTRTSSSAQTYGQLQLHMAWWIGSSRKRSWMKYLNATDPILISDFWCSLNHNHTVFVHWPEENWPADWAWFLHSVTWWSLGSLPLSPMACLGTLNIQQYYWFDWTDSMEENWTELDDGITVFFETVKWTNLITDYLYYGTESTLNRLQLNKWHGCLLELLYSWNELFASLTHFLLSL